MQNLPCRVLALLAGGLLGCSGDQSSGPTEPIEKTILNVVTSKGVLGDPPAGTLQGDKGRKIHFAFAASPGFTAPKVFLDSTAVGLTGDILMDASHTLIVSAIPVVDSAAAAPSLAAANALFTQSSAFSSYRSLLIKANAARVAGDSATVRSIRQAEYAALLAAGPDGLRQMAAGLAGRSLTILGASDEVGVVPSLDVKNEGLLSPARLANTQSDLFSPDTIVPTTFIYVNGILNFVDPSQSTGQEIVAFLRSGGFSSLGSPLSPNPPRPGAPLRLIVHWNPVIALNGDTKCLERAVWSTMVSSLAPGVSTIVDVATRALGIFGQPPECAGWLSSNGRVVQQLIDSNVDGLSSLDRQDEELRRLITAQRSAGGGRNVLLIAHSQGTLISRSVIAQTDAPQPGMGCTGVIAIGSPMNSNLSWPFADRVDRIIAKGTVPWSWDFFYPFGTTSRTDGMQTSLTAQLDADLQQTAWQLFPWIKELKIHLMDSYLNPDGGLRSTILVSAQQSYQFLATKCAGRLSGSVADLITGAKIAGATVTVKGGGESDISLQTNSAGAFTTNGLRPVLHDVSVSATGYETVLLNQRLVPFRATAPVQASPILLGKSCAGGTGGCSIQGTYSVTYNLSGVATGNPISCTFFSTVRISQTGQSFSGVITTASYQQGCQNGSTYVEWIAGNTALSAGVISGADITFVHDAKPPWNFQGRLYASGFRAVEPAWEPGLDFHLRVEMVAVRTSTNLQAAVGDTGQAVMSSGPSLRW